MKITHDFHIHTHLSHCGHPSAQVEHYMKTAKELGLKKIGFADHFRVSSIRKQLLYRLHHISVLLFLYRSIVPMLLNISALQMQCRNIADYPIE